jgi:hypothetical protein
MPAFCRLNKFVILFSVIATMVLFCGNVLAQKSVQNKTVVVIGSAPVHSGNVQSAREKAIKEGLVTAVARMTEEILQVEALVDNFPQINELVYEQTDKYVQDYKVQICAGLQGSDGNDLGIRQILSRGCSGYGCR